MGNDLTNIILENLEDEHLCCAIVDKKSRCGISNLGRKIEKPFLRWAGGKSWMIKHWPSLVGDQQFNNYHEPFLGGGAIFFSLSLSCNKYLSDLNADLIDTYISVRDEKEKVVEVLSTFSNDKESYYRIRDTVYTDSAFKAARFIFLNNTSYNGIYRVNLKGVYNVPYGYRTVPFFDEEKIDSASNLLKNAELFSGDFCKGKSTIMKNDLVFLDPPYTTSHNNNGFIKYNQKLFSLDDQKRLSAFIDTIKQKEAFYILTNAAHQTIKEIFTKGDKIIELKHASLIGGQNAKRGEVSEYVFTNIGG